MPERRDPTVPFDRDEMLQSVARFLEVYRDRPLTKNAGGMGLNHSWATWFILDRLRPSVVVESGIFRGHSTWLIEQAAPDAEIYSFDIDLSLRRYESERAVYTEGDFTRYDWSSIDTDDAVCFFDDHQNAYQRLIHMNWFGFRRAIFEDNWPTTEGDCYSLRRLLAGAGAESVQMSRAYAGGWLTRWRRARREDQIRVLGHRQDVLVDPNTVDRANLARRLRAYQEMPPLRLADRTMWETDWTGPYATEPPLIPDADLEGLDLSYSYLAYVEIT